MIAAVQLYLPAFLVLSSLASTCGGRSLAIVVVSQPADFDRTLVRGFRHAILRQSAKSAWDVSILDVDRDFRHVRGAWTIIPLFKTLIKNLQVNPNWIMFCEPHTHINLKLLTDYLEDLSFETKYFIGRALRDEHPTIIHHFYGHDEHDRHFIFPDFAAGVIISKALFDVLLVADVRMEGFSIDAKHEFAKFILDVSGVVLTDSARFCLLRNETNCITQFIEPDYKDCPENVTSENSFFAVKTFSGFHKTRIIVLKRTWVRTAKFVEYFSDIADYYIPTISLGIENTERGHCAKTIAILKRLLNHDNAYHMKWFVIADDDTLISVPRLHRFLSCYDSTSSIIMGERYGFGFDNDGKRGYDYPTGGSSIVFSYSALRDIVHSCTCPNTDSPDDMIIGICAQQLSITIIHSAAFHQARSIDYPILYLKRISPISFHKFDEIDPYEEYLALLHDANAVPASRPVHAEL